MFKRFVFYKTIGAAMQYLLEKPSSHARSYIAQRSRAIRKFRANADFRGHISIKIDDILDEDSSRSLLPFKSRNQY